MTDSEHKIDRPIGTDAYDNWRSCREGKPLIGTNEYLMYSDAFITGEVTTGVEPCQFFNLIPQLHHSSDQSNQVRPSITLRLGLYGGFRMPDMTKTDSSRYHGGSLTDEIAALASLLVGVRFRAGAQTRMFNDSGDPLGQPVLWTHQPDPILNVRFHGLVLPSATGFHSIMPFERMKTFADLSPEQAITLVRSARLYQDALWLAESEPNLSWLLLVSAIETAATSWKVSKIPTLDRLTESNPELVKFLDDMGIPGLSSRVADEFVDSIGSTKKFVDFLITFLPPVPTKRPNDWGQLKWEEENLRKIFRQIYGYRSKALHDGRPFPAPMCEPPSKHETWETIAEHPVAIASGVYGGIWLLKDTPMHLHIFEYIARSALNSWWLSMVPAV